MFDAGRDHQVAAMRACARGFIRHGIHCDTRQTGTEPAHADIVVTWNDRVTFDVPQLVLEAGYINGQSGDYVRDRLRFVSSGWNGLHGRADPVPFDCPPDRWKKVKAPMKRWRTDGEYALVCDQHPGDKCAPPSREWWHAVADHYDGQCDVVYRPHPLLANPTMRPLKEALQGARSCFTWNSTAAIEAVLAGVPTWSFDRGSMAWDVTAHDVNDEPALVDRRQWAYNLAYRQWTHAEFEAGDAWAFLKGLL